MNKIIRPAIITFPGSNCERDIDRVLRLHYLVSPQFVWHRSHSLDASITHVILPGGFSFGDYLRAGALAAVSPIMKAVREFALSGMPVLGICNGFQILCEARLLPGVLMRNHHDRFVCRSVPMTWRKGKKSRAITLPIAHRDGRYFADEKTLSALDEQGQIFLAYDDLDREQSAVVNGSRRGVAGICAGPKNNVIGLMPHPERAVATSCGEDGRVILDDFFYGEHNET